MLQNWHLVEKKELAFSFRPTRKTMFHVDVDMKLLWISFKNYFSISRSDLILLDVFIKLELCYTLQER